MKHSKRLIWLNNKSFNELKLRRNHTQGRNLSILLRMSIRVSYRHGVRKIKVKAQTEMQLTRDIRGKNKSVKYVRSKRKTKESIDPLLNGEEWLIMDAVQKDSMFNVFFTSVFTVKVNYKMTSTVNSRDKVQSKAEIQTGQQLAWLGLQKRTWGL